MFLDELTPIVKELGQQPVAFVGGLFSGALRLKLNEDPLKSWLDKQSGVVSSTSSSTDNSDNNRPQSIAIE